MPPLPFLPTPHTPPLRSPHPLLLLQRMFSHPTLPTLHWRTVPFNKIRWCRITDVYRCVYRILSNIHSIPPSVSEYKHLNLKDRHLITLDRCFPAPESNPAATLVLMSVADAYPVGCRFVGVRPSSRALAVETALHIGAMKRDRTVDVVDREVDARLDERVERAVTVEDGEVHAGRLS